jgi:hypothetical protein
MIKISRIHHIELEELCLSKSGGRLEVEQGDRRLHISRIVGIGSKAAEKRTGNQRQTFTQIQVFLKFSPGIAVTYGRLGP